MNKVDSLDSTNQMRLQRYLARCGIASRRHAEEMIVSGHVCVNGKTVTKLGSKVDLTSDVVEVDGRRVSIRDDSIVIMLNKPAGFICTMNDPQGRKTVADLVPLDQFPELYPIGRLDCDTTGLLLFATDGYLGNMLIHPSTHVPKSYYALVEGSVKDEEIALLQNGLSIGDEHFQSADVSIFDNLRKNALLEIFNGSNLASGVNQRHGARRSFNVLIKDATALQITIYEGKNRQIRRMFSHIGHPVIGLHRFAFGMLELGKLKFGEWVQLSQDEIDSLYS